MNKLKNKLNTKLKNIIVTLLIAALLVPCASFTTVSAAVKAPPETRITSIQHGKTQKLIIKWKYISSTSGYQIQYADNRLFLNPKTVTIKYPGTTKKTIQGVSSSALYYARIRTFKTVDGESAYSDWSLSSNCKVNKTAKATAVKVDGEVFELRQAANQTMGKYDTMQGGTVYGNYGWFILYDRKALKCKLAKVNMRTLDVLKVSDALAIPHGSDVAYNPNKDQLVVAHGPSYYKNISIIDPSSLRLIKKQALTLPKGTPGASSSNCSSFKGVTALTYNAEKGHYVGRLRSQGNLIFYDDNLKAIRYVKLSKKDNQLYQGMDAYDDFTLVGQSFKKGKPYNIIAIYDQDGNYLSKLNVTKSYELQNVFRYNDELYVGLYRSYYKTWYLEKGKIKTTTGPKNKIKGKIKYTKLQRDNYFYKVTGI